MPFELLIPIEGEAWTPGLDDQRGMHSILMNAWAHSDVALAERIHDAHVNPFTQGLREQRDTAQMVWHITLLDDALYEPLLSGLYATQPASVQRRPIQLTLDRIENTHTTFDALYAVPPAYKHRLQLHTPTRFEQRDRYVLIPDAYLCWQSWLKHWHAFAPPRLPINVAVLDVAAAHLVVAGLRIHSKQETGEKWDFTGTVGTMTFTALQSERLEESWWQQLTTLAALSRYCGTGPKTAFGMGRTAWCSADSDPSAT